MIEHCCSTPAIDMKSSRMRVVLALMILAAPVTVKLAHDKNVTANSGIGQTAHEQYELSTQVKSPTPANNGSSLSKCCGCPEGFTVQYSVSNKTLTLKTPDGKTRKLKLAATHPNQKKRVCAG
jgi:hypothetical protein